MHDRPLLVAVEDGNETVESVEELEADCAAELCDLTERWLTRLPASSAWRRTCAALHSSCSLFLDARSLRRVRQ